jgi:cytochrome b pre-mRNA-processing protein 3
MGQAGMAFFGLGGAGMVKRRGFELYTAAVQAARDPLYFIALGVPDTLDGRFDLVGVFVALLIRRLRALEAGGGSPASGYAQAVFDAMFADMDFNLRELGVTDMTIGRRVRAMWEAFHGRALAYEGPLDAGDADALAAALVRNVWRGADGVSVQAERLAGAVLAQDRHLAQQGAEGFRAGQVAFLPAGQALMAVADGA